MIQANIEHKDLIVGILLQSFKDNQSVNFIVRQDQQRLKRINALMEYSFEMCLQFGKVWVTEEQDACALVLYPKSKKTSVSTILADIKLIFKSIGICGIGKALKRESRIKKIQPNEDMAYLWFIGVDPLVTHRGKGTKLLQQVIDDAASDNLPVYLETSTIANLPWYENLGFEIYNQLDLGYMLFFLKRRLDKL
jgi:ribosomal protein S18 acetylase RimI-like enzyme